MAIRPYLVGGKGSLKKPGFWVGWQRLTPETRFLESCRGVALCRSRVKLDQICAKPSRSQSPNSAIEMPSPN
ncbi:hypothetical protein [Planktothricoides raciborskii]|uniref:Uncharacterized protein n=2 Tax=Planktothricoides raciborskii TaxID=132608 RepID=A0AAU8JKG7_9CYAN|nr:hypothetical protein [Planktothricoides raciborskii]MBD2544453.1 hypothetical protein [Planktothricoides raciborskii FACHB-1370]MBD2585716.1 hypothetical protein [Planktothricoides raciborskii FACHB-1261]